MEEFTQDWQEYQKGIEFKNQISLFNKMDKCERFFADDQWNGVVANGLPTPVLNIIKRIIQWKVSQIMSQSIKYKYSVENIPDETTDEKELDLQRVSDIVSDYSSTIWEKVKQDILNEKCLTKAAINGTVLLYDRWDPTIDTFQDHKGDIKSEIISAANYYPGNPNDTDVQAQPYIIIAFRELVSAVKKKAKLNGIGDEEINEIVADDETTYQAGDIAKKELESKKDGKCIVLKRMWKDDEGIVQFRESTKSVVIEKDKSSRLKRYPLSLFNWTEREACAFGEGDAWALIPNQISINKLLAMAILSTMNAAYPKCIYNEALVGKPNNQVGACIPIKGGPDAPLKNVIDWTTPGEISQDVYKIVDILIQQTKEMNGATETAMGEVRPENQAAFIAVNQASVIPLESIQRRFYNFIEDIGLNRLDMLTTYYDQPRKLSIVKNEKKVIETLTLSEYKDTAWGLKVDVGPSSRWSEVTSLQTLDKLLESEKITFVEWLERVPKGILPKQQELLELRKQQAEQEAQMAAEQAQQQAMQQQQRQQQRQQPQQPNEDDMVQFVESLPQDMQQQISSIEDDEEQRQVILQLMQESQQAA